jgi:hypothetical protein
LRFRSIFTHHFHFAHESRRQKNITKEYFLYLLYKGNQAHATGKLQKRKRRWNFIKDEEMRETLLKKEQEIERLLWIFQEKKQIERMQEKLRGEKVEQKE